MSQVTDFYLLVTTNETLEKTIRQRFFFPHGTAQSALEAVHFIHLAPDVLTQQEQLELALMLYKYFSE